MTGQVQRQTGGKPAHRSILETIGDTPMVELTRLSPSRQVRIYAKLESNNPSGSMKDRIAVYMIEKGEKDGELTPARTILEPTSGNTGISLAMVGRLKGYRTEVVIPDNVSPERIRLLESYGAIVHLSPGEEGTDGATVMAQEMASRNDGYYMPFQYGNEANPRAHYETTGDEIVRDLPDVDVFVAGLGTGGTLMGVGRRLKEHNQGVKVVAVSPRPDDDIPGLRSLEGVFTPPILDMSVLDASVVIDSEEAFAYTKLLTVQEGIFAGVSSGSVAACARRLAEGMDGGKIVCLMADGGWKYLSTGLWTREWGRPERDNGEIVWL